MADEKAKVIKLPTPEMIASIHNQRRTSPGRRHIPPATANNGGANVTGSQGNPANGPVLPVAAAVSKVVLKRTTVDGCENFGLFFQRFITYPAGSKWDYNNTIDKNETWEHVKKQANTILPGRPNTEIAKVIRKRQKRLSESLTNSKFFTGTVAWRLAIGLGHEHPLENGITLHRIYGIPYLPGSAIKGLTRAWKLEQLAGELGVDPVNDCDEIKKIHKNNKQTDWDILEELLLSELPEDKESKDYRLLAKRLEQLKKRVAESAKLKNLTLEELHKKGSPFRRVFGSPESCGQVVFMDSFPEELSLDNKSILEPDILNPHYGDYYPEGSNSSPADYLDPVPCLFLAVREGTRFSFLLHGPDKDLVREAAGWCKESLQEFGIGAKTAAGYGEMIISEEQNKG